MNRTILYVMMGLALGTLFAISESLYQIVELLKVIAKK